MNAPFLTIVLIWTLSLSIKIYIYILLDGYLDWYFKDYVTLHYSVIIIVLYIMFLQVAQT